MKAELERQCRTYCAEYFHDGSWWGITFTAYDWADAEARAKKMSLQLLGEQGPTISAGIPAGGLFMRGLTNGLNLVKQLTGGKSG